MSKTLTPKQIAKAVLKGVDTINQALAAGPAAGVDVELDFTMDDAGHISSIVLNEVAFVEKKSLLKPAKPEATPAGAETL